MRSAPNIYRVETPGKKAYHVTIRHHKRSVDLWFGDRSYGGRGNAWRAANNTVRAIRKLLDTEPPPKR